MNPNSDKSVLSSRLAGSWYTAQPEILRSEINALLEEATAPVHSNVCALIMPHAGLAYSGMTAAYALNATHKSYNRIIVIGPSHRVPMFNQASIAKVTHYATPLGEIPLDLEFIQKLITNDCYVSIPSAHENENSVQMQLPLLQSAFSDFKLVPIIVGALDIAGAQSIAQSLLREIDEDTLVIASTDFTHYGRNFDYSPFPLNSQTRSRIEQVDMTAFNYVLNKDAAGWIQFIEHSGATICGRSSVAVLLAMLPTNAEVSLLHYTQSGDLTGDYAHTVSYLSAAITGTWTAQTNQPAVSTDDAAGLTKEETRTLLQLARNTLTYYLEHHVMPTPSDVHYTPTEHTLNIMGAFVTLHKNKQLRGCIGEIFPRRPLVEAVMEHAVNSGVNDPRFPSVSLSELPSIDFEISALSAPTKINDFRQIVLGKHGVVLYKNGHSAVFLPQVATEQGWDIADTLTHLSMKAGLSPRDWQRGCRFEVFTAQVFGEKQ